MKNTELVELVKKNLKIKKKSVRMLFLKCSVPEKSDEVKKIQEFSSEHSFTS